MRFRSATSVMTGIGVHSPELDWLCYQLGQWSTTIAVPRPCRSIQSATGCRVLPVRKGDDVRMGGHRPCERHVGGTDRSSWSHEPLCTASCDIQDAAGDKAVMHCRDLKQLEEFGDPSRRLVISQLRMTRIPARRNLATRPLTAHGRGERLAARKPSRPCRRSCVIEGVQHLRRMRARNRSESVKVASVFRQILLDGIASALAKSDQ